MGLTPAKSKTIGSLNIPDEYFADFLRGCIDGDGNISIASHPESKHIQLRTRLFSASPLFLNWIKNKIFNQLKIKGGWIEMKSDVYVLAYAKADSIKLLNFMYYPKVENYLKRKYEIAKQFFGRVAELAQAHGLGPCSERSAGSNPASPTTFAGFLVRDRGSNPLGSTVKNKKRSDSYRNAFCSMSAPMGNRTSISSFAGIRSIR